MITAIDAGIEVGTQSEAVVLVCSRENCFERRYHRRIELSSDRLSKPHPRNSAWHRLSVRSI